MLLVNSLAIGDGDSAMVVEGWKQTVISGIAQNKKLFINSEFFENRWGNPLEGFGELNLFIAADPARVVGPLRSALGVIFQEVALRSHDLHGGARFFEYRCDVQEGVWVKSAELGLVRLKQQERWGPDGFKGAGHPCARGQLTRLFGSGVSHAVVGVEGVFFGMGKDNRGLKLTDSRGEPLDRRSVQFQWIITKVHSLKIRFEDGGRFLAFGPPNSFDLFFRLARFFPE